MYLIKPSALMCATVKEAINAMLADPPVPIVPFEKREGYK
jgi:hypothetical protein